MKKDLFGFENQGTKYDLYRPRYPAKLLNKSISKLKGNSRYLDIATGTGQILFQLYSHFNQTVGVDLSQKMISVCQNKVKDPKYQNHNITFARKDFMDFEESENLGYDLITIGQALHWLPISQSLQKAKSLLKKDGVFSVYGYILKEITSKSEEETKKVSKLYQNFYDNKVKSHFDFDCDQLHTHYSSKERYPFEEIFPQVERTLEEVPIEMEKDSLIAYLKTYSGYNTYLEQHPGDDPIVEIEKQLESGTYVCNFNYFCVLCQK